MKLRRYVAAWLTGIVVSIGLHATLPSVAQASVPCKQRVWWVYLPPATCLETVIEGLDAAGIMSVGGLAFTPDGTLYVARPALREVWRLRPDGKDYFLPPEVFASNLPEAPLGLTYDEATGAWFAAADTLIVRLTDANGDGRATGEEQQIIVRDLPGEVGGWLGDVRIGPDRRLYVSKAASCDACVESDPRRGALLSMALDGSDLRVVARGLRNAFGFAWTPNGNLFVVDHERQTFYAELNLIPAGTSGLDFGWPRCAEDRRPVAGTAGATDAHCAQTAAPMVKFAPDSHPTGLLYYTGDAFPDYRGGLLVAFAGSWNNIAVNGHDLWLVRLGADDVVMGLERLIPHSAQRSSDASLIKTSLHPFSPYALATSPNGWIYLAIAEGRVYRFRPG